MDRIYGPKLKDPRDLVNLHPITGIYPLVSYKNTNVGQVNNTETVMYIPFGR